MVVYVFPGLAPFPNFIHVWLIPLICYIFIVLFTAARKFNSCYMLAKELGTGAFSVVKLGINIETSARTAVKIVSKKKLSEEDYQSLLLEIEILGGLNHPHIIRYGEETFAFSPLFCYSLLFSSPNLLFF